MHRLNELSDAEMCAHTYAHTGDNTCLKEWGHGRNVFERICFTCRHNTMIVPVPRHTDALSQDL